VSDYVALLRGINVGGKNVIPMAALKACFEREGFDGVSTYIQSGNVLFDADETSRATLTRRIEKALAGAFRYAASVVLRSRKEMRSVVDRAPKDFGADADAYRYDVVFLKEPLDAPTAMKSVSTRPGVDQASAGAGVLYFSRLIRKASQSRLAKLTAQPVYQRMTIRNWNTTTTLLRLMGDAR
jgi:uncharacterized protein (DUF1697 family)